MSRPSFTLLFVLLALCTAPIPNCAAVRLPVNLQEYLQYHEEQQNPEQEEEQTEQDDELLALVPRTTPMPQETSTPVIPRRSFRDRHHFVLGEQGSGQEEFLESTELPTTVTTTATAKALETEEPSTTRQMTTCCRLGEEAGRKRHHCNPDTYLPRMFRNRNRGHNFRQTNKHPSQEKTQFDKCVSGVIRRHAVEFQTCCEEAYKRMWQWERGLDYHQNDRTHILEIPFTK